jgi:hypothetical protein
MWIGLPVQLETAMIASARLTANRETRDIQFPYFQ